MHACKGEPASHALYSNRSAAMHILGNHEKALSDAKKGIALDNTFVKMYHRKASALVALGRKDEAKEAYATAKTFESSEQVLAWIDRQVADIK